MTAPPTSAVDEHMDAEISDTSEDRDGFSAVAIALALFAIVIAVWGVALGWRAIDEAEGGAAGTDEAGSR